jgi:hypothetical protein
MQTVVKMTPETETDVKSKIQDKERLVFQVSHD